MAEGNGEVVDDLTGSGTGGSGGPDSANSAGSGTGAAAGTTTTGTAKADDRGDGERTEDYPKLLEYGLDRRVSTPGMLKWTLCRYSSNSATRS